MEATGVYWKPVWHILEGRFTLILANAAHIKGVPGRKSDVNDATWIADLLAHGLIRAGFVPPQPIQEMRDLTRTRKAAAPTKGRHPPARPALHQGLQRRPGQEGHRRQRRRARPADGPRLPRQRPGAPEHHRARLRPGGRGPDRARGTCPQSWCRSRPPGCAATGWRRRCELSRRRPSATPSSGAEAIGSPRRVELGMHKSTFFRKAQALGLELPAKDGRSGRRRRPGS